MGGCSAYLYRSLSEGRKEYMVIKISGFINPEGIRSSVTRRIPSRQTMNHKNSWYPWCQYKVLRCEWVVIPMLDMISWMIVLWWSHHLTIYQQKIKKVKVSSKQHSCTPFENWRTWWGINCRSPYGMLSHPMWYAISDTGLWQDVWFLDGTHWGTYKLQRKPYGKKWPHLGITRMKRVMNPRDSVSVRTLRHNLEDVQLGHLSSSSEHMC